MGNKLLDYLHFSIITATIKWMYMIVGCGGNLGGKNHYRG